MNAQQSQCFEFIVLYQLNSVKFGHNNNRASDYYFSMTTCTRYCLVFFGKHLYILKHTLCFMGVSMTSMHGRKHNSIYNSIRQTSGDGYLPFRWESHCAQTNCCCQLESCCCRHSTPKWFTMINLTKSIKLALCTVELMACSLNGLRCSIEQTQPSHHCIAFYLRHISFEF